MLTSKIWLWNWCEEENEQNKIHLILHDLWWWNHSLSFHICCNEINKWMSSGWFRKGKIYGWCFIIGNTWNNSSVLYHDSNHKANTNRESKENKIMKKLKNKFSKNAKKGNWNVWTSKRIIDWCARKSEMLLRTHWWNKMIRSNRKCC